MIRHLTQHFWGLPLANQLAILAGLALFIAITVAEIWDRIRQRIRRRREVDDRIERGFAAMRAQREADIRAARARLREEPTRYAQHRPVPRFTRKPELRPDVGAMQGQTGPTTPNGLTVSVPGCGLRVPVQVGATGPRRRP